MGVWHKQQSDPALYEHVLLWTRPHSGSEPATDAMDKKSSAFTIDRILSADDNKILGLEKPSAPGPCEEKPAPESMNQTDLRSTCCFCSHCGEILHTAASKRALMTHKDLRNDYHFFALFSDVILFSVMQQR